MACFDSTAINESGVWFLDSGCSNHMCGVKSAFKDIDESKKKLVRLGDNKPVQVERKALSENPTENDDVVVDPTPANSTISSPMTSNSNISSSSTSSDETPPRKVRSSREIYERCTFTFFASDPTYFEEAVEHEEWCEVMKEEITSIQKNETWELINLPDRRMSLTRWQDLVLNAKKSQCASDLDGKLGRTVKVYYVIVNPRPPEPGENEEESVAKTRERLRWDQDDEICRGHILNGMSNTLFDAYHTVKTAKELWNQLERRYITEDATSKRFIVSKFFDYKMVDGRSVMEQFNEIKSILDRYSQHKLALDEFIVVTSIIDKLPPSWKNFRNSLKHRKEDIKLDELGTHLRIEEDLRKEEKFQSLPKQVEQKEGQRDVEENHENEVEPRRSKRMRIAKTYGPDFYIFEEEVLHISRSLRPANMGNARCLDKNVQESQAHREKLYSTEIIPGLEEHI
ncbi:hypothetical protein RJ639_008584 [Escallonia herrerae]|uniref:Retrovirus-related Pol polyprotein from transposon TNT 1-94-like beta-barrel domain-containing protein n=1 Tax=Escallonia herrerae TaxID=1293975 RepID=A0AA89AS03_9ASTE|nr:hypothetical protein RJ639_008584 [Escallonia herrerae]